MESDDRLAQPYDAMFERNIGHLAKRGREVEVWVEGLPNPKVGFLAGMDEEFIQLCITKTGSLSSIRRDLIISMDETGNSIGSMIRDYRGTEQEEWVNKIRGKTDHFQKRASQVVGRKDGQN